MATRRIFAVGWLILVSLVVSFLPLLLARVPAVAQASDDEAIKPLELMYDDGVPVGTIKGKGCGSCRIFQGVRFTLPEGLPSAPLTAVKLYASGTTGFTIYITKEDRITALHLPFDCTSSRPGWNTIALPEDVVVPPDFWIIVRIWDESSMPYYDAAPQVPYSSWENRSFHGASSAVDIQFPGDLLLRAILRAEVDVGPGQRFGRIQEAIDAVGPGTTIVVHEDTYDENVTVYKSVYIKSLSGPEETIVQTPFVDRNTFTVTAPDVTLSGFTIQGASAVGSAGVRLDEISDCLVSGNIVLGNSHGIYVGPGASRNIILQNECKYNTEGIYIDGSMNYISGNKLHGNTATIGSAVFVSNSASGNVLRFNTIEVDQGTNPAVAAGPQVCTLSSTEQVNAVDNWWGSPAGPANPANANGEGSAVGDMVSFDPWLKTEPVFVKTVAAADGDYTLNVMEHGSASILKQGSGKPVISFASFAENPTDEFKAKPLGKWIDVLFNSTIDVIQVEVRVHYTADEAVDIKPGSLRLYWWNGEKWKVCSKSGVDEVNGFVWARVNVSSKPGLADLNGTFFTAGIAKGGGGFDWWLIPLVIVIVLLLLVAFRLFWVLAVKRVPM